MSYDRLGPFFLPFLIPAPPSSELATTDPPPSLHSYCTEYGKDPVNDAYDLETLKDFMNEVGHGMNGIEGEDDTPSLKSVKQAWKDFTAEFRRHNDPIPRNTTLSVTNVRKSLLWTLSILLPPSRNMLIRP